VWLPPPCVGQSNSFSKLSLKRLKWHGVVMSYMTWLLQLRYRVLQLCQHQGLICAGFVGMFGKQKLANHDTAKSPLQPGWMSRDWGSPWSWCAGCNDLSWWWQAFMWRGLRKGQLSQGVGGVGPNKRLDFPNSGPTHRPDCTYLRLFVGLEPSEFVDCK